MRTKAGWRSSSRPPTNDRAASRKGGIPGLRFTDRPRGASTCSSVPMARGAAWDADLEERVGRVVGLEARAMGASILNAPCVNAST